jgi:hypothetical protein
MEMRRDVIYGIGIGLLFLVLLVPMQAGALGQDSRPTRQIASGRDCGGWVLWSKLITGFQITDTVWFVEEGLPSYDECLRLAEWMAEREARLVKQKTFVCLPPSFNPGPNAR